MDSPKYSLPEPQTAPLRRQRLIDFLHDHVDQPLRLVCAPAGYGKTTLLVDYAIDSGLPVCWCAADETDRDPRSFLESVYGAIRMRFPAIQDPGEPRTDESPEFNRDWQITVRRLLDGIRQRIPEYFVLVIDDFHTVSSSPAVTDAMDFLLRRLPDNCRVILSSREVPKLRTLPKLISQRRVAGLGPTELRFTADEIKVLFSQAFDLEISADETRRIERESEGWITSILLTTRSLWKGLFGEVLSGQGKDSLVFEYMASEVFSQQSPAIQTFLLATSICNEFDSELAAALTGTTEPTSIPREIESGDLLTTRVGGPRRWYRYHHLFRDYLRQKLRASDPSSFLGLHVRAAEHFLSRGEPRRAIDHYIQGEDFDRAIGLLEANADDLYREGLWETLGDWLAKIPEERRAARPRLLIYLALVYRLRGENDESIGLLNTAIDVSSAVGQHAQEAQALMYRSVALRFKGSHQMAIRDARAALKLATDHGIVGIEAEGHWHLGNAYAHQGKFRRAEKEFRAALNGYQQQGDLYQLSQVHDSLGSAYSHLGDSASAAVQLEQARQGWLKLGNDSRLGITLNNMAVLYHQQGQYETAEPLARESISLAQATNSVRDEAYALMSLADVQRWQGKHAEGLDSCQESMALAGECMETHLVCYGSVAMGETYRLMGERDRARGHLMEALALARERGQGFEQGLALTSLGIIERELRQGRRSEELLKEACQILGRSGQAQAHARARFHLAQALFLSKNYTAALEQMDKVAEICGEPGHDGFLLSEGSQAYLLIQYAAARAERREFFSELSVLISREQSPAGGTQAVADTVPRKELPAPRLVVRALGSLTVHMDESPVLSAAWGSTKAREMFLFLLYHGQPTRKEKIVEALWPEISPAKANSNFHSTLYRVRGALYPNCVERDGELYRLNESWTYWLDAKEFDRLVAEAGRSPEDSADREACLGSAIDLYNGPFLEDTDSPWCNELRTELEMRLLQALSALADRHESRGEYQQAIALLSRALDVDEFQEETYYRVMDLYLSLGDPPFAARVYAKCLSVFGEARPVGASPAVRKLLARLS